MKEKTAIILGATGLIGGHLVHKLASDSTYKKVEVWVRRPNQNWPEGVTERIIDFDEIQNEAMSADEIFCCLGTTIRTAGSKEAFEKVDYLYPLKAAEVAKKSGVNTYAIVTAMGSDKNSSIFYNKVKGKVESALQDINFQSLGIFRPSMLLGDRPEYRFGEQMGKVFMKIFNFLIPAKYKAIPSERVAQAMLQFAQNPPKGVNIIENKEML